MKVTVIAEAGINHQGDINLAKEMVIKAKEAGADIFKTQWYDPEVILGRNSPYFEEAKAAQFDERSHALIKQVCDEVGIEWCLSVFHKEQLEFTEAMGIKRYKVASRSATDLVLLEAIRQTKKPVIVSTGLISSRQIEDVIVTLGSDYPLSLLYCVCEYPTKLHQIDLSVMRQLKSWGKPAGFSSHCPHIAPSIAAVAQGAAITENHVVIDKYQKGCDVSSSLTFEDFTLMTKMIRDLEEIC